VFHPDGRLTQRVGIVPDVVAQPTMRGHRDGRREVLEAALQFLR
jgi:C-terminal processing protease CtpA/Prc